MKIAYIMRGVPGSGKSTLAKQFNGVIHSTDSFFYVDGEYCFNPKMLREYHDHNFKAFCQSLNNNIPVVILDNTNTMRWYFERYVDAAQKAGYSVVYVILPHPSPEVAAQRTTHNVPMHAIERMIAEWED